jgi:2,3-bisphosphoglycerate-dependent phosphoglycerate mutase
VPQSGHGEENDRPLSGRGREDARALVRQLGDEHVAAVYSSPYPRAHQTVEPLAASLGLAITVIPDLRERLLCPDPRPDWLAHVHRSFADDDHCLPGGESSRVARARVGAVLDDLEQRHPGETLAAASHGDLIALALQLHDPAVGFELWQSMPMPAVYPVDWPP